MNYAVLTRKSDKEPWLLLNICEDSNAEKTALNYINLWRGVFPGNMFSIAKREEHKMKRCLHTNNTDGFPEVR